MPLAIEAIHAREVLDSRGQPTVEVEVALTGGWSGRAIVPSGASTGRHEALELRDGDRHRYRGRGVLQAVHNVNEIIAPELKGADANEQQEIDGRLIALDGTPNKSRLGANALLGVSLGVARAVAAAREAPLWLSLGGDRAHVLPLPMVNIISGGLHAGQNLDFQDFLVMPVGAETYGQALAMSVAVYQSTRELLADRGLSTLKADEGGFGPALSGHRAALDILLEAVERAHYQPGKDIAFAIDVAATHFFDGERYQLTTEGEAYDATSLVELLAGWVAQYPIVSIEDGLAEDDWEGWKTLTARLGGAVQLIGDDLFTTNPERVQRGIGEGVANAVLVKMNQIGTLTETLQVVELAQRAGYRSVISARSGESEDSSIADIAVATTAGQIKIGSVAQSERLAKYNQLLRIEEELGDRAVFAGRKELSAISYQLSAGRQQKPPQAPA
jgi:enolase